jgi:hypothetical protein
VRKIRSLGSLYGRWQNRAYGLGLLAANHLPLPHFLGIGAQKAGTTWLHANLRRHPDVFVADPKELHHFDETFHRGLRFYAGHFTPGRHQVRGEITPAYGILPVERIRFIRTVMPEVKLIFLMRNPIDRAWSHAVMQLGTRRNRAPADITPAELVDFLGSEPCRTRQ